MQQDPHAIVTEALLLLVLQEVEVLEPAMSSNAG